MSWEQVQLLADRAGWERLPENGFGAAIAAAAGVDRLARRPAHKTEHQTQLTTQVGRRVRRWTEPRSISDQSDIDEAANEYLAAAGLTPRPPGYEWFVRTPDGASMAMSFVDAVSAHINQSTAVTPTEVLAEARRVIEAIDDLGR